MKNNNYYEGLEIDNIKKNFTSLYINTYMNKEPKEIKIEDKDKEQYEFMLYLDYNCNIKKGRMAIVRRIGMKIEDKKIKNMATAPFNAVMIPVSDKEDKFLKSLENESHTSLSSDHIKDQDIQNNAKRFINNISKEVGKYISDIMKMENPVGGTMDTSDILYSVESSFKKEFQKDISTVQLTRRNSKSKRNIVKVKTHVKSNNGDDNAKTNQNTFGTQRKKSARRQDGDGKDLNRVRFGAEPEEVKRLVLPGKEILYIDLSNNYQYSNEHLCDIVLHIVDGTGKEYSSEFYINNSYFNIVDMNTNLQCSVKNNTIKNVSICNKKIQLKLQTTRSYNSSLKFIYYVEV
ncbi:hypothetical protein SAMN02745248_00491 [Hathewaya proteolytica DSM 3090]|uniref:Uncharacterized protein n=1 Tax=Hathewaya proteolytica DSM 3090 TaxID=1121331 RepID=A0A1M6KJE0_9CLOT|nr:hypothetical protein [Hathewaya proteolytica]SHJ59045.1 hypothetical protein SAMN02745248_00491 [Hathewaya proteolytica DSM 3090]